MMKNQSRLRRPYVPLGEAAEIRSWDAASPTISPFALTGV